MYDQLEGQLAFAYLRISDDVEGKQLGVQRQEEDIRALAAQLGVTLVRIYCDNDISASTNSTEYRPDYEDMMTQLEAGPVKIVLSYTKARLTRKPEENERQIKLARAHGVQYKYVRGQALDLTISNNRKMDRIQNVMDAGTAEDIQELALRKKLQNAREGKWDGGARTFGYGLVIGYDPVKKKDIIDPYQARENEVAALKDGKRRTLAGDSQFICVQSWNSQGVKTTRAGQKTTNKKTGEVTVCDGRWDVGKFKRTLLNESYVQFDPTGHPTDCPCLKNPETGGTRIHKEERHRAKWPFVFTRAEHDAMVAMFNGREKYWVNKGSVRARTYLLSGFTECGGTWRDTSKKGQYCGGVMYGQGKTYPLADGSTRYVRRYACKKWDKTGERLGCCSVFRVADQVEAYVTEQVLYRFDSPEIMRALTPATNELRMAEVIQELAELQIRRELLAAEYAAGEHEKEDYHVMKKTVVDKLAVLDTEKKQLMSAKAKSLAVPTDGGLRALWEDASIEWRASVTRLVVEKVVIRPTKRGGKFDPDDVEIVWLH
ncbi:recombinase family protein [Streptomyces sp. NBC_01373]|uniref:recombinase family protein n=1 Tax=Streptomyces sp. NBC_01373 TaxID=2903843 RepID=UPI002259ABBB|nr:recombinase family protein [Streptomyces sp. NBC_01373]MCX4698995.1 recombinase family protein [Streptomyces sp. NBC_01373]